MADSENYNATLVKWHTTETTIFVNASREYFRRFVRDVWERETSVVKQDNEVWGMQFIPPRPIDAFSEEIDLPVFSLTSEWGQRFLQRLDQDMPTWTRTRRKVTFIILRLFRWGIETKKGLRLNVLAVEEKRLRVVVSCDHPLAGKAFDLLLERVRLAYPEGAAGGNVASNEPGQEGVAGGNVANDEPNQRRAFVWQVIKGDVNKGRNAQEIADNKTLTNKLDGYPTSVRSLQRIIKDGKAGKFG